MKLDPEIDCPSCEDGIKHSLVTAHGVQSVDVDVLTNRITILYDPKNIMLKALVGRIRVFGYTATEVNDHRKKFVAKPVPSVERRS